MYETFKTARLLAGLLIAAGCIIFLVQFFPSFSISIVGIITVLAGAALLAIIRAAKAELDRLRIELVDVRKMAEGPKMPKP
ncbi:hypothetical protein [Paenibacillus silvisoli]|uniref:hypothetical protein n=1 Tax=Paenibacillus silvisoli TaxID=3110539 RepID=UPI002805C21B|nr:hypothetical protein [Paenibacillus silvisoli]